MTVRDSALGIASQPGRTALLALALVGTLASAPAAWAQDNSPGSFTLPPGQQQTNEPPSNVQGPVDSESTPPRRTDQPAEPAAQPPVTTIAPVPLPRQERQRPRSTTPPRTTTTAPRPAPRPAPQPAPQAVRPQAAAPVAPAPTPVVPAPTEQLPAETPDTPVAAPLPTPELPTLPLPDSTAEAEMDPAEVEDGGSLWWWAAAGLIALISLIVMVLRKPKPAVAAAAAAPTATVPTPPLRNSRPVAPPPAPPAPVPASPAFEPLVFQPQATPARDLRPAAPPPPPAPPQQPPASTAELEAQSQALASGILPDAALAAGPASTSAPVSAPKGKPVLHDFGQSDQPVEVPRLLLDFTTLGIDVTLVNAVARYHLGVTNMADIAVSKLALHGAIIQARRGMPPTVDPMRGDSLLPHLQKIADIEPGSTQRCEGQIRLPLAQIEPIEMQGRLLFVPVVHIWIGYDGPDGTRYAVTQSFVLGEESSPPGPRVGPLRLDLGPRRFTSIGQRPLQPA
ncbi:hypothetical protein [Blastomonas sp. AAP53]|uniref:hypothetical protein n=1 Tax=Blastomonas sp. AAP53 TaxID=1248760 RepID=UPI000686667D|nr:hypothetical protein [Blastomonas sp. AAP53]